VAAATLRGRASSASAIARFAKPRPDGNSLGLAQNGSITGSCPARGTPLDAQNIVNRHFKPLLEHAGLPPIRWHDLRHTCATLLLGRGVHPKLVQHLLGHASITMTLDRYSHWIPSMGRHAAEGMDEALG
jgi:integrase